MKKIITLTLASILLLSCGGNENNQSVDALINSKNVKALQDKKTALQSDIAKIEEALAKLDVKTEEALVAVATVKDTLFTHYLEIQGSVDTKENILVQPEFNGTLTSLTVKAGDRVSKGQILGRVDDAGMSQQLASLENQYELAKTTFERQKNLWDKKIGSEIQYLQAQTQMVSAQKGVAQMKSQLAKTIIRAPFNGVIDEVFVEKGQVVAPSQQGLMRIVNLNNMYVSTTVPESYIGKLKVGDQVDVFLTSLNKTYKGKVRQVGSYINPSNRSFGIEVGLPNPDNLLRPNQVAKLKIIDYVNKDAIVVPTSVVQHDGNGVEYVYTVDNSNGKTGIAKKTKVSTGKSSDNYTEILSGLSSNDIIVTDGVSTISEGMKLNF
ncbi:efflux RND transporter periplasmic adaptor subunit [Flavobacterium capsici]|uniref:Efflux RND transporter periplasmic adaptor subunit n=1 Tax=Flavobacterium capsici TaxID=3075618 RepID=A0AA96F257_9FLAO|nr:MULTISPECIES: efflux RND transporter periplasmic adaptor subunit [unclassified Flavobacterium]WNM19850.1 efflux RND transporter periplasmic adaptor subunit [Flavobacterium sp. PMR2A8]WNM21239.1 efflux RND transporter periplasmic adaptor subunit [Flavobacterium sp. PMTSA4]